MNIEKQSTTNDLEGLFQISQDLAEMLNISQAEAFKIAIEYDRNLILKRGFQGVLHGLQAILDTHQNILQN